MAPKDLTAQAEAKPAERDGPPGRPRAAPLPHPARAREVPAAEHEDEDEDREVDVPFGERPRQGQLRGADVSGRDWGHAATLPLPAPPARSA